MENGKLFQVQDDDCPKWVIAKDFQEAIEKWRKHLIELSPDDVSDLTTALPNGVSMVADEDDVVL